MRVLAMYLPQFHRVPENDAWWGEGFTDWVSAKSAEPLFDGHAQPHVPLKENYYNLLDKKTMQWQAELMKQYGIDGMCIYHYWFKDGRGILEKPAENLLKWTDINMPFCFSWANETWARSWSRIVGANVWSNRQEPPKKSGDKAILLEQRYGGKDAWRQHFEYLLPFFQDERYIKLDGKPVFLIYNVSLIPCLEEMREYWCELAKGNGFPGIYIIGSNCIAGKNAGIDAQLIHEPQYTLSQLRNTGMNSEEIERYEYEEVWKLLLNTKKRENKTYFGGFVGYDDTPRRGREGLVIHHQTPQIFRKYLARLLAKNAQLENEFVFLNAWNEWGEGMHLEPDEANGYAYLEAVRDAKREYGSIEMAKDNYGEDLELKTLQILCNKYEKNMKVFDNWMRLKENGGTLASYLEHRGYRKIAMYGYGTLGKHFIREIEGSGIALEYIIDRQGKRLNSEIPVYGLAVKLAPVDAVVITVTFDVDEIRAKLCEKGFQEIVTIEEMVTEIE